MSSLSEEWLNVATSVTAFLAIFSGAIVFTPKDAVLTRSSAVAALFACNWAIYLLMCKLLPTTVLIGALGTLNWICCFSAGEIVLFSRAAPEDLTEKGEKVGTVELFWRAVCLYFNLRRTGTKWEIRDLSYDCPKSRIGFLAYKGFFLLISFLIVDAASSAPPPEAHLVAKEKEAMFDFSKLGSEDVIFRLIVTTMMWSTAYAYKYILNSSGAVFSVALGMSKPEAWPRLFNGSFSSLTSVRGFWSVFWHQTLRKALEGWADAISDNVLCLRRGTLASRYTRLFIAFFISGIMHHAVDSAWGLPHSDGISAVFFSIQSFGIMAEDAVQALTKSWGIPQKVKSVVGFFWMWAFLWWTTPRWFYGTIRSTEASDPFPFSIVQQFM